MRSFALPCTMRNTTRAKYRAAAMPFASPCVKSVRIADCMHSSSVP